VRKLVFGAVCVVLLAIAGVAYAATQQKFSEVYTSSSPSKSVGLKFAIEGTDPADPANNNRPKPSNSIDIFFASGTVFNNKGAVQCKATDADFQSKGVAACPASSRIDNGKAAQNAAVAKLKSGNPITVKVFAFNRKGGIILYLQPSVGAPFALRPTLKGRAGSQHLLTTIPKITVPNDEVILTKLNLATKPKNIGKAVLVKSPPKAKCSAKTHKWVFKAKWNYRDGTKETKTSTQKCKR
jgi:hypothetical protein